MDTTPGSQPLPNTLPAMPAVPPVVTVPSRRGITTEAPQAPPIEANVLHIVNGEHFSGAERVQSHLGRCLPQFGIAADFACVKPGRFAEMLQEQQGRWGQGFETPMSHRADLRPVREVVDLVRCRSYDLLHAHTPRTAMVAALASRITGTPWVYHVHSPASRDSERALVNHLNAWVERLSLRRCAHLITVSNSLREDCIQSGASPENVTVVHNGVPAIRPARSRTPKPGQRWTIGMVALMRPRKGLEVVLESLSILRQQHVDVVLRCIGPFETDAYREEIDQQINRLGLHDQVEQRGFTSDVPLALSQLDAMVLPSLYGEGLPMVVLEAMAAGLPVIATSVEGTPEAIRHGIEGLLAEPRDPASLAAAIASLVRGEFDWSEMSEAAADRHETCFSDLAMAESTAKVYRSLLDGSNPRT